MHNGPDLLIILRLTKNDDCRRAISKNIKKKIKRIFDENKHRYGVRRVHQELINRGYQVNHKRVQRIMHEAGLAGKTTKGEISFL